MNSDEVTVDGRLYPAVRDNLARPVILHLARAEARKDAAPALFAVCPGGVALGELTAAPLELTPRWWRRRRARWCPQCDAYRAYLARRARTAGAV